MAPPIFMLIKLLFNPDVSKKMILQIAYKQAKAIGFAKILALLLSSLIVAGSSIIKIPQIKKITNPPNLNQRISVAKGLSLEGISLELLNHLVHVVYNQQNNNPFVGYGESMLLGLQNVAIILLIEYYNARHNLVNSSLDEQEKAKQAIKLLARPLAAIIGSIVILGKLAPASAINGLKLLSIPISIGSKLPQIKKNYELKSASHLSKITVNANVFGSLARVFTTVTNFNKLGRDYVLLAGYASSLLLNGVLAGQVYYYQENNEIKKE